MDELFEFDKKKRTKMDGWNNFFTGLGTKADKSRHTHAVPTGFLLDMELETIYADDGLGANIVDFLPEDMMKRGWKYEFDRKKEGIEELSKVYEDFFNQIKGYERIEKALKWARLYGGGILLIGAYDGGKLEEPLNIRSIKSFETLRMIPRNNILYGNLEFQMDASKPRYGEVEYYHVNFRVGNNNYITTRVHYSRVIELHGVEIPSSDSSIIPAEYRFWGLSVLQRVQDRLKDVGSAFGSLAGLFNELSVGKYKYADLAETLALPEGEKRVQNRLQAMDLMKSVFHSVLLDVNEDYIRENVTFNGTSDVLYQFFMLICASSGYPMTRLFGISPAGLNSTGEGDIYNYYDKVESKQRTELLPILDRIFGIFAEWKGIDKPTIRFNPLEQMTEKEQAQVEEKRALAEKSKMDTYQGYIDMGIMTPEIVEELEFGESLEDIRAKYGLKKEYELPDVEPKKKPDDEGLDEPEDKNNPDINNSSEEG